MTSKKMTLIRVLIYLLFAFALPFTVIFIYVGFKGWTTDSPYYSVITSFSMLCPAIANILTRIITKEGFGNAYIKFKIKGNRRYLLIALLLPVLYSFVAGIVSAGIFISVGSIGEIFRRLDWFDFLSNIIFTLSTSIILMVFGFGEEFGWRGYLTPKLSELMKEPPAIIVSGIIWGLWHAPIIVCGHNFGKDYDMYPYLGIGMMCIICVIMGFYFTKLTKACGSVIPASLAHMVNNNITGGMVMMLLMSSNNYDAEKLSTMNLTAAMMLVICVFVTAAGILTGMMNKKRNNTKCDES